MNVPFTSAQFWEVFAQYNSSVFPMQFLLFFAGCSALLLCSRTKDFSKTIGFALGSLWIWVGLVYHILVFTQINKAAYVFGAAFITQGVIFIVLTRRNQLRFVFDNSLTRRISFFFILFGLLLYPLIGCLLGKPLAHSITLGLPCPTTIFTFGLLGLQAAAIKKRFMIIPLIWSFIGLYAAVSMGVYQDVVMPIAALYTFFICNRRLIST
ncbi:MAG: DUF6064 family protein [Candidatus Adiutrix sp.]|jgi:hypothetical protein|nr:DUF6064 family protein [Candidatus Adiutrix sp.]